jgi:gamma-glutamylcyclotransferase (GGCT)/AIG2-like uncharacterized protein YtfP
MKKLVTVYGSLLSGFGNWKWHLDNPESTLLGEHVLELPVKMLNLGGFPGLIKDEKEHKIFVETYEVPENVYVSIEHLEGYRAGNESHNFYNKMEIETPFGKSEIYLYNARDTYHGSMFVPEDEDGIINWKKFRHGK